MESIRQGIEDVKTCLDEATHRPGGAKSSDVAQAMRTFVGSCYLRHLQITSSNGEKLEQVVTALYGPPGKPEEGLIDVRRQLCRLARFFAWGGAVLGSAIIGLLFKVIERSVL